MISTGGRLQRPWWPIWFCGLDGFSLKRSDITRVPPERGREYGLPAGIGFTELRLLPETKSSPHRVADIVIGEESASGLQFGKWMDRLLAFAPVDGVSLFSTPDCTTWDSHHFRSRYLWPLLEVQRISGEATLQMFNTDEGSRIQDKVYSLHSYRRGSETFSRKFQKGLNWRGATTDEIYEHGRWRKSKQKTSEPMDIHYTQLPLKDRLNITLFCL